MQYKKDEVKYRILESACAEFSRTGFYRASVMRIATQGKTTIGNLYRYFKGKDELFEALVADAYDEIPRIINKFYAEKVGGKFNFSLLFDDSVELVIEIYDKYGSQLDLLLESAEGSRFEGFGKTLKEKIARILEYVFLPSTVVQPSLITEIIADGFINGVFRILKEVPREDAKNKLQKLILFYFNGANKRLTDSDETEQSL